jgi:hypothetical protein
MFGLGRDCDQLNEHLAQFVDQISRETSDVRARQEAQGVLA